MKRPEDDDDIQIFKVVGEVDNKDIDEHIKEAGDKRKNKPGENGKLTPTESGKKRPDLPTKGKDGKDIKPVTDFGEFKIYGNKLEPERPQYPEGENGIDEDCAVSKVLGKGIEKIDNGDDDLECIKVSGDKLTELAKPENNNKSNQISNLFKEADDDKEGANYYYRKVLGGTADRPGEEQLIKIPGDTDVDNVYDQIKDDLGNFKSPEEGIQLVKIVGDINPNDITKHMNDAKDLYGKKGDDDTKGVVVQSITINRPNKNGVKEPVKFIKAKRSKPKPGEEPISFYKLKGDKDVKNILDQIQNKGKPDGKDGDDYETVKGPELPDVKKLFDGLKHIIIQV